MTHIFYIGKTGFYWDEVNHQWTKLFKPLRKHQFSTSSLVEAVKQLLSGSYVCFNSKSRPGYHWMLTRKIWRIKRHPGTTQFT